MKNINEKPITLNGKEIKQILFSDESDECGLYEVIFQFTNGEQEIQLMDIKDYMKLTLEMINRK